MYECPLFSTPSPAFIICRLFDDGYFDWEYQTTLSASWETCMQVKKQQLQLDMEQWTGSKLGKKYVKAIILPPCLFNWHAEYIMRNAGLEETQAKSR